MTNLISEPWPVRAACAGSTDADLWFAPVDDVDNIAIARTICGNCPARSRCGQRAVETGDRYGMSGGYHTEVDEEWRQLQEWVASERPARTPGPARHWVRCRQCEQRFQTVRRAAVRCPDCSPRVGAGPVQSYLTRLRAVASDTEIAAWSGLAEDTLQSISRNRWINKDTATRILSIQGIAVAAPARAARTADAA